MRLCVLAGVIYQLLTKYKLPQLRGNELNFDGRFPAFLFSFTGEKAEVGAL